MSFHASSASLAGRRTPWGGVKLRPKLFGWLALVSVVGMTIVLLGVGRAELLRYGFPAGAAIASLILLVFHPVLYLGWIWWLWFLTPFVRRLVDLQTSWDPTNPVLLAPLLATAVCILDVVRHLPKLRRQRLAPFALVVAGIAYAYPFGMWQAGLAAATYALLLWIAPVCLGLHLALHADRYEAYRQTTARVFVWGTFVMGVYGLWQFFAPPLWDRYWMINSGMGTIGLPEPMLVRVFSTMNSPQPFAMIMVPGLMLLLTQRGLVHWTVAVPGYAAFVLTLVRTAWLAWLVGFLAFALYIRGKARRRLFALFTAPVALMVASLAFEPVQERLLERGGSFTELDRDLSFQQRLRIANLIVDAVTLRPWGLGLGTTGASIQLSNTGEDHIRVVDSGLLDICLSLGVPGGFAFLAGVLLLLLRVVRPREDVKDDVARATRGAALGIFAAMLSLTTLVGSIGVAFWHCLGLALAAQVQSRSFAQVRVLPSLGQAPEDVPGEEPTSPQQSTPPQGQTIQ